MPRPSLQQTVGKATCRTSNIQPYLLPWIDLKNIQRSSQFLTGPANKRGGFLNFNPRI
jgi:hypothetical protein